ncbi:hypothetical protein AOLI_G00226430 [Acnodon oligacanthus]
MMEVLKKSEALSDCSGRVVLKGQRLVWAWPREQRGSRVSAGGGGVSEAEWWESFSARAAAVGALRVTSGQAPLLRALSGSLELLLIFLTVLTLAPSAPVHGNALLISVCFTLLFALRSFRLTVRTGCSALVVSSRLTEPGSVQLYIISLQ